MVAPVFPVFAAGIGTDAKPVTTSTTTTTETLSTTTGNKTTTFDPSTIPNYFGQDLGPIIFTTEPSSFIWTKGHGDFLKLNLAQLAGKSLPNTVVYYNSSHTAWKLSSSGNTINIFFKAQKYQTKISIQANLATAQSICLPFEPPGKITQLSTIDLKTGKTILLPIIQAGNEQFSWADIPATYSPTWTHPASLCLSLPAGISNIDPIALDGSGQNICNGTLTCTLTLTTTSSPDVIVFFSWCYNNANNSPITISLVADVATLTWHSRAYVENDGSGRTDVNEEWYAVASGTLTADVITVTYSSVCQAGGITPSLIGFGVSGATTVSPFDTHAGLPVTSTSAEASVSTSNPNDFIYGDIVSGSASLPLAGTGFTLINSGQLYHPAEYQVVSSTQSGLTIDFTNNSPTILAIGDAICKSGGCAGATVTQPIKITTANGAPSATISISGCAVSNATFTANGNVKHYSSMTASCTITLTTCGVFANTRCEWNVSPHPTASQTLTFPTCALGTCSEYDNTSYLQIVNIYRVTAQTPTTWDGNYSTTVRGTFVGISNYDLCALTSHTLEATMTDVICSSVWSDYNQAATVGGRGGQTTIGNTWSPSNANVFTGVSGGNTYTVNYVQSTGGGSIYQPSDYTWMLLIPIVLIPTVIFVGKRRR